MPVAQERYLSTPVGPLSARRPEQTSLDNLFYVGSRNAEQYQKQKHQNDRKLICNHIADMIKFVMIKFVLFEMYITESRYGITD